MLTRLDLDSGVKGQIQQLKRNPLQVFNMTFDYTGYDFLQVVVTFRSSRTDNKGDTSDLLNQSESR